MLKDSTYKKYLLATLTSILAFNYVDRQVLGLVMQDIKIDLVLTDTQLGLITGIAFSLFYAVMGIPIAHLADRGNRVTIISLTTAFWSITVALCGFVINFTQLFLVRIGVAIGEAGCIPPAHSLIADSFSRFERPRAAAIYMLGGPLSVVIGFGLGGWLNESYGWRITFILLGVPGIIFALLAKYTLFEPRVSSSANKVKSTSRVAPFSFKEVRLTLWRNKIFRHLLIAYTLNFFFMYGIGQWQPVFFIRSFDMSTSEIGIWFAIIWGLGGLAGTYTGGSLAGRYAANNEKLQLRSIAIATITYGILGVFIYTSPDKNIALGLLGLSAFTYSAMAGPVMAIIQTIVPSQMRAMSFAVISLASNLVGAGLGPLFLGVLSDSYSPLYGEESIRYALLTVCPGCIWAAIHFWISGSKVEKSFTATDLESGSLTKSESLAPTPNTS